MLRSDLQHDVERWAAGKNFVVWGDSLGAILAYELIVHMGDSHVAAGLLGLCVSGNSGPTAAAVERGMGESVQEYLDREVTSVADMTDEDRGGRCGQSSSPPRRPPSSPTLPLASPPPPPRSAPSLPPPPAHVRGLGQVLFGRQR